MKIETEITIKVKTVRGAFFIDGLQTKPQEQGGIAFFAHGSLDFGDTEFVELSHDCIHHPVLSWDKLKEYEFYFDVTNYKPFFKKLKKMGLIGVVAYNYGVTLYGDKKANILPVCRLTEEGRKWLSK